MIKAKDGITLFLYSVFNFILALLFLLNIPLFREPHGFLVTDQLSDFSNTEFIQMIFWGSVALCILLGVMMLQWLPSLTPGMASNLWVTTLFLLWVDSMFALAIQFQTIRYLLVLAMGILFIYLFFFSLSFFDFSGGENTKTGVAQTLVKPDWLHLVLWAWMVFYFILSWLLIVNSYWCPEFQLPLALGFWALCFLNYLLWMFLKKSNSEDIGETSRAGRLIFGIWFLALVVAGLGQKWLH